jgi:hypothetical protein
MSINFGGPVARGEIASCATPNLQADEQMRRDAQNYCRPDAEPRAGISFLFTY